MTPRLPAWAARLLGRGKKESEPSARAGGEPRTPSLPDNPYRRFYTRQRRLEDLAPRPPKDKK